jgi:hypothetical protein
MHSIMLRLWHRKHIEWVKNLCHELDIFHRQGNLLILRMLEGLHVCYIVPENFGTALSWCVGGNWV